MTHDEPKRLADGRKLRSAVKWQILRVLATKVGAPILAAELIRRLKILTIQALTHRIRVGEHRSGIYTYLYRLAEEGLLEIERLKGKLKLYLTSAGRKQLAVYDTYWERKSPNLYSSLEKFAELSAQDSSEATQRPARRGSPTGFIRNVIIDLRKKLARLRHTRRLEGSYRTHAFISYDVPQEKRSERRQLLLLLRSVGFSRMHASMYVGPAAILKPTVEAIEGIGLLPHTRWGTLTEFKP